MELTFNKVGKYYETVFELTADANLHIEFESATPVKLYQRTTGEGWDLVDDVKNAAGKATDIDLTALVYPKYIRITSKVEPTYAAVVSDGEVTEIKSQEKSIEISSNGTTSVEPDAGFSYLSKVDVKVDVAQSGEGGGSASSVEYLDVSNINIYELDVLIGAALECKGVSDTLSMVSPAGAVVPLAQLIGITITQAKVDFNTPIIQNQGGAIVKQTALEALLSQGFTQDYLAAIPRITEEEFYTL